MYVLPEDVLIPLLPCLVCRSHVTLRWGRWRSRAAFWIVTPRNNVSDDLAACVLLSRWRPPPELLSISLCVTPCNFHSTPRSPHPLHMVVLAYIYSLFNVTGWPETSPRPPSCRSLVLQHVDQVLLITTAAIMITIIIVMTGVVMGAPLSGGHGSIGGSTMNCELLVSVL
jgi:hypothetical protein